MGQAARRGAPHVMRALQLCQRRFRRKIPAITILHPSRAVSSAASGIFAAAMKFEKIPIICGDEAEFEASWEAWKAWAKMEEAPWRALNSEVRLEHADFTKSLLDTG